MLTDCSVKCLGACTRRAFGDARCCQRVSQRWNRYHPYFITGEATAAGDGRSVLRTSSQPRTPPPKSHFEWAGPVLASGSQSVQHSCDGPCLPAKGFTEGILRRPHRSLQGVGQTKPRRGQGRGWGSGGTRTSAPSPPGAAARRQSQRRRRGRGFELGRAGLDSVKLGKVICDFNKAEGLRGISCLGDGGRRWKCIHGLVGQGPGWGPGEVRSPTASRAPGLSSAEEFLSHSRGECRAGLPVHARARACAHTHTHTHTHSMAG